MHRPCRADVSGALSEARGPGARHPEMMRCHENGDGSALVTPASRIYDPVVRGRTGRPEIARLHRSRYPGPMPDIDRRPGRVARFRSASWRDLLVVGLPTVLVTAVAIGVAVKAARFAPPKTIHFVSGPDGSGYRNQAEKYQKILAREGVKLEIIPSRGALDNLDRLANPAARVDVGFVQGGLAEGRELPHLVSLGSVYPQPLMVYCRHPEPVEML